MVLTAVPVGFIAGLFGIGGGLVMVPFLFYVFESLNIDSNYIMHLAVGTSFGIIIPTSFVSVMTHYKHGVVDIGLVKTYGVFTVIGVSLGTIFAVYLNTKNMVLFFSLVIFLLSLYLMFLKEKLCFRHECMLIIVTPLVGGGVHVPSSGPTRVRISPDSCVSEPDISRLKI